LYKANGTMRNLYLTLLSFLISHTCYSQKLEFDLDNINPIVKSDQHGDSLRKYFSITFYSYPRTDTSLAINKTKTRHLLMNAMYSNKVAINYRYALNKIPQLNDYLADKSRMSMQFLDAYAGNNAIPILDSGGIIITVNGINRNNVNQYQFRVLQNKTNVVLPWTKPKLFTKAYWVSQIADSTKIDEETAYLGQFKAVFGNALTFEVRRIDQPGVTQVAMSALWIKRSPKVVGVFAFDQLGDFLKIVKKQWSSMINSEEGDWAVDTTLLKLRKNFSPSENRLIFYMDDLISRKEMLEYQLVNGNQAEVWKPTAFDLNFIWLNDLAPGSYKLRIRYSIQRQHVTEYPFTIETAWYQTVWAKLAFGLLAVAAVGFIVLLIRSRKQAEKIRTQSIQKQLVQTELKSIRTQFNPHFVFNALNSIQGLITKNDQHNATKYLVEFGTLMREALKASGKEFTTLAGEIKMLENYLRLEQLRFGFSYRFAVDPRLSVNDIETPSLLLQPIVENAVKHGISALQENGLLIISFTEDGPDMVATVTDNGDGFKTGEPTTGFGLQLTHDRIKLLNQTLDNQEITFAIDRANHQTHVIICFKNLLI
jgi:two-component system LytT family sensor kinase